MLMLMLLCGDSRVTPTYGTKNNDDVGGAARHSEGLRFY